MNTYLLIGILVWAALAYMEARAAYRLIGTKLEHLRFIDIAIGMGITVVTWPVWVVLAFITDYLRSKRGQ